VSELDYCLEILRDSDICFPVIQYICKDCGTYFYYEDDTAEFCPKCGSRNVSPEREVEIVD
jgi:DNA-directed RNA polymerase subunit RPC12/RpoP